MKYRVLKDLINAPAGTELYEGLDDDLMKINGIVVIEDLWITSAIEQGFIKELKEEPKRWRASTHYYFVNTLHIEDSTINSTEYDELKYKSGNYFKSKETAALVAEAQKLLYEYLHTIPGTPQQNVHNNLFEAIKKAREAVLADDSEQSNE